MLGSINEEAIRSSLKLISYDEPIFELGCQNLKIDWTEKNRNRKFF